MAAECWPAAWAIALLPHSWTVSSAAFSKRPDRFFRERCCGRNNRIGVIRSRRGRHRGGSKARRAAVFRGRQRGGGVSAAQGDPAHHGFRKYQGLEIEAPEFRNLFRREDVLRATGTRSACTPSRSATRRSGAVTPHRSKRFGGGREIPPVAVSIWRIVWTWCSANWRGYRVRHIRRNSAAPSVRILFTARCTTDPLTADGPAWRSNATYGPPDCCQTLAPPWAV